MVLLHFELLSVENGIAKINKMCWGCGNDHEMEIPLDDLGTERCIARMCEDCVIKFCTDHEE